MAVIYSISLFLSGIAIVIAVFGCHKPSYVTGWWYDNIKMDLKDGNVI